MLLFRSEETLNRWCAAHDRPRRPVITLDQLWRLAVVWYEDRLGPKSRRPAAEEMVGVFSSIGLTGPFWDPKSDLW